jgi:hypothetical protein
VFSTFYRVLPLKIKAPEWVRALGTCAEVIKEDGWMRNE